MYDVTNKFNELAFARDREVSLKAKIGDSEYTAELMSLKFTESMSSDSTIGIGETCSNYIELKMQFDSTLSLSGEKVQPSISFDGSEWCPIGTFYISEIETEDEYKTVKIKAYDQMAYLTDDYEGTATTCEGVVSYLASKHSFEVADTTYPSGELITSVECTEREMLGYIAGLMGKNARINRDGKLEFTWYKVNAFGDVNQDTKINAEDVDYINDNLLGSASKVESESILGRLIVGKAYIGAKIKDAAKAFLADVNSDGIVDTKDVDEIQAYIDGTPYDDTLVGQSTQGITEDEIYLDGVKLSGCQQYTISCLISGTEDNVITSGSGRSITFTNPFMTQAILDGLVSDMLPFSYYTGEIQYRGNPAFECGDVVRMKKLAIPIMQQEFDFDGGMDATIESYGLSDESIKLDATPSVTKTLERKVSSVQKVVEEINNSLLSGDKGYMVLDEEVIDGVKRLSGFKIMDTPSVSSITKGWQASKNGIGWSSDGFKTISKLGLDMANGKIYADQIAAGSVITNSFQIGSDGTGMTFDGDTGKLIFGSGVEMGGRIRIDTDDYSDSLIAINFETSELQRYTKISAHSIYSYDSNQGSRVTINGNVWVYDWDEKTSTTGKQSYLTSEALATTQVATTSLTTDTIQLNGQDLETRLNNYITSSDLSGYGFATEDYVSGNYAKTSHTHSGSQISGGYPKVESIYLTNPGTASVVAVYRSTESGILGVPSSSRRYKNSIADVTEETLKPERLYGLPVRQFKWNEGHFGEEEKYDYNTVNIGFIAEEVAEIYPFAAVVMNEKIETWEARNLLPPMLALIQQQKKDIDELKKKVEALS